MHSFTIILVAIVIEELFSGGEIQIIEAVLYVFQPFNKYLWVICYQLITAYKVGIYIVDNSPSNTLMTLKHMKKHCATSNEGFNVSYILKIIEISW